MQFANAQQQQSVNNESHSLKEEPTALRLPLRITPQGQ